jgi:hypothetical protein
VCIGEPKAAATAATLPLNVMRVRLLAIASTRKPCDCSHDVTASRSWADAPNRSPISIGVSQR